MKKAVQTITDARSRGIYITADQYPYIYSEPIGLLSTFLEIPKYGTDKNTQKAKAAVVDKDAIEASILTSK